VVPVVVEGVGFEVESREPQVRPFSDGDLSCARIDVGVVSDGRFLVTAIGLGVGLGPETGPGFDVPVGPGPAGTPQPPALLGVRHRASFRSGFSLSLWPYDAAARARIRPPSAWCGRRDASGGAYSPVQST